MITSTALTAITILVIISLIFGAGPIACAIFCILFWKTHLTLCILAIIYCVIRSIIRSIINSMPA
jgi:hypothetical protein